MAKSIRGWARSFEWLDPTVLHCCGRIVSHIKLILFKMEAKSWLDDIHLFLTRVLYTPNYAPPFGRVNSAQSFLLKDGTFLVVCLLRNWTTSHSHEPSRIVTVTIRSRKNCPRWQFGSASISRLVLLQARVGRQWKKKATGDTFRPEAEPSKMSVGDGGLGTLWPCHIHTCVFSLFSLLSVLSFLLNCGN